MSYPGRVRMHYGHPDVFDKMYIMTRGGMSKATRQLHISEDVFGGYNHCLRGGEIKHRCREWKFSRYFSYLGSLNPDMSSQCSDVYCLRADRLQIFEMIIHNF